MENILTSTDKLLAFKNNIQIWKKKLLLSGNIEMFPLLLQIQDESVYNEGIPLIICHLESLTGSLDQYLPYLLTEMYGGVRNPSVGFSQNSRNSLSMQEEGQPTELQCDLMLKMKFNEVPLDMF
jgi:hypothetical protein